MSDTMHGHVTALVRQGDGDHLAADAVVGATTLTVLDVADFSEGGGQLRVGTEVYDYIAINDDTSTITLVAPGLSAPAETDDPVDVWDPEAEAGVLEFVATVVDDTTEDVIQAVVEHDLADRMADNIRGLIGESVVCEEDSDGIWILTRVLGRSPEIDGDYVMVPGPNGPVRLPTQLLEIFEAANVTAEAANAAAALAQQAYDSASGKNTIWRSIAPPGTTPNVVGDTWFQFSVPDDPTDPDAAFKQNIVAQYIGLGGTAWRQVEIAGEVIAYLDAGKLTAGSAFINALQVLTLLTLGNATTNGVIQSYDFANQPVGVLIDKNGLVAKGGTIAGSTITGGTITGAVFLTDGFYTSDFGVRIDNDGIYAKGGTFVGSYFSGAFNTDAGTGSRQGSLDWTGLTFVNATFPTGTVEINSNGTIYARGSITSDAGVIAGGVRVPTPTTTAAAANAYFDSAGNLLKSTSSQRYKKNVEPLTIDIAKILALEPKMYDSVHKGDHGRYVGFIAEDADTLGLDAWVVHDDEDQVDGFAYGSWTVAQQVVLRALWDRDTAKDERIEELEQTVTDLAARLATLEKSNKTLAGQLAKIPGGLTK